MWSFDETVDRVVDCLTPLYECAAQTTVPTFINLDMEEYRDLDLTIAVFERILSQPPLLRVEAGIVLQTYLPDALSALQRLTEWAIARREMGGAAIKVRLVKGANLAMENVDARLHDWPVATYRSKQETDTNYKRVLDWVLTPRNTSAVKIGVAGHNLFDVALAWLLAGRRGVEDRVEFEMLLGMATGQAAAVRRDVGQLLLYTPVVDPREFDAAIAYLVRRLEENASSENFMSAVSDLSSDKRLFERERDRFLASVANLSASTGSSPRPFRSQNRLTEWATDVSPGGVGAPGSRQTTAPIPTTDLTAVVLGLRRGSHGTSSSWFCNEPDTDPAIAANREWGRRILSNVADSQLGEETLAVSRVTDSAALDRIIETVVRYGVAWGDKPALQRAEILDRAAIALAANRDRLIEVMAHETGKTIAEGDTEVSEAVDFAHYYAARARDLDRVQGATFVPVRLTVVVPPWNFPVAIPAGGVLAALAAGSGVIIKPAPQACRSATVMVEALWEAGVPHELLALVDIDEGELGHHLVAHDSVDRVVLTGSFETAKLFRSWRADLPLLAETSGKNAIIVTPSADLDLAVADIVKSAFGHAGQKCSAASLVITVGSVSNSARFRKQLVDATTSVRVGYPENPISQMGPLIEPASGKLLHALTTLGGGEEWLCEPRQLDETGRLWSPGVRIGVQSGSYFHLTEFFGPVLGILHADSLSEAIDIQNAVEYGLTAGLHSLNSDELAEWVNRVEAGNLYVNRGITGAIVQRQPFGGWKRSSVGAGTKAGGPNYLFGFGSWVSSSVHTSSTLHLRGLDSRVSALIEAAQPHLGFDEFEVLRRAALSDAIAWDNEFSRVHDPSGLEVERNLFRYRPIAVTLRANDDAELGETLRAIAAALVPRSPVEMSSGAQLPESVRAILKDNETPMRVESDSQWLERAASSSGIATPRIRLVGGGHKDLAEALGGTPDIAIYSEPPTLAGRVELLPYVREQAISLTNHRFGNPVTFSDGVV